MNQQLKTVLLTVLTLSVFVIALVELSGVSQSAIFNKYNIGEAGAHGHDMPQGELAKKKQQAMDMPKTIMQFDDTAKFNFGTIEEGEVVKHAYHFKNVGEHPLLIYNAVASCGCTVPSYPKEPIPPGGEGDIMVEFNSNNREGHQEKNVMIYSNSEKEAMSIGFVVDVK